MAGNANSGRRKLSKTTAAIKPLGKTMESVAEHIASVSAALAKDAIDPRRADSLAKLALAQRYVLETVRRESEVERLDKLYRDSLALHEAGLAHQARERQHVAPVETTTDDEGHYDG